MFSLRILIWREVHECAGWESRGRGDRGEKRRGEEREYVLEKWAPWAIGNLVKIPNSISILAVPRKEVFYAYPYLAWSAEKRREKRISRTIF